MLRPFQAPTTVGPQRSTAYQPDKYAQLVIVQFRSQVLGKTQYSVTSLM